MTAGPSDVSGASRPGQVLSTSAAKILCVYKPHVLTGWLIIFSLNLGPQNNNSKAGFQTMSQVKGVQQFFNKARFRDVKRIYTPEDVLRHRGSLVGDTTIPLSCLTARKLFGLLEDRFQHRAPLHTLGVLDPVQMSQLARCKDLKVGYVSGWACSSNASDNVSPDLGDYPYDTVPNQVGRIFNAQLLHDKKLQLSRYNNNNNDNADEVDYMKPLIADADMGHGGVGTVMKVARLFAEKGAAAIHLEDQLVGSKKCGHLAGTVVVPVETHLTTLHATRFQWDLMNTENLIIARTDSCNSKLISSAVDPRDHQFIKGIIVNDTKESKFNKPLNEMLLDLQNGDKISPNNVKSFEKEWYEANKLMTFDEMVKLVLNDMDYHQYLKEKALLKSSKNKRYLSLIEMKQILTKVNNKNTVEFNWDYPLTKEGYYMYNGCLESAIERSLIYAPYSDMIWLETKTPDLAQAKMFAKKIHEIHPHVKLVYNLSPSFNWQKYNIDIKNFIWNLAKEGFILQLVSLAGLHISGLAYWSIAKEFQYEGMKTYVEKVQKMEKQEGSDMLLHQKWSGIEYVESITNTIQNGTNSISSSVSSDSFTESQF
ncbi:hypothetical protein TPHA_0H00600 [Tetrapisispora phaffii CBS 4417]|uniref:Isocitrate lyase n=1 Tax=Tetrapisispora phaffii (strain ATCC 24235 / CBS 4417 / NBRC 1672 / NRRL Y-8282 / UCD 70-5) TaxID=1071381 RepID=G8BWW6_TETPH|nr:hypothetical protein TPHA_0H00600 [Tetrapisispora phaffii CBS 4417]CCE64270.1 hypothetical protein TPHA_0H00600 [Tetrapisispora phaffii CBS 4417]